MTIALGRLVFATAPVGPLNHATIYKLPIQQARNQKIWFSSHYLGAYGQRESILPKLLGTRD
jgi:hypothetical protein